MKLHREGRATILIFTILLAVSILTAALVPWHWVFRLLVALPFLVFLLLILWFFRIPVRVPYQGAKQVVAPADGLVVVIEKTVEEEYFHDERIQVSIFMSPLNVHQNVYPVSGKVVYTKYHKGKYLVAWHPKSSTLNERSTVVIRMDDGTEILMRQIAGAMARRICSYAQEGDKAEQSEEMGFIKFGSRVDVFLPLTANVRCKLNEVTLSRVSVLADI